MNTITFELFICLVSAHILGDFLLQNRRMATSKTKWKYLIQHTFIVTTASYLICGAWLLWQLPLLVFISHILVDLAKAWLNENEAFKERELAIFLADQAFHLSLLLLIAFVVTEAGNIELVWIEYFGPPFLHWIIMLGGLVLAVRAGGIMIAIVVKPMLAQMGDTEPESKKGEKICGLREGGNLIGQLERLLIYLFVMNGQWVGIGFLLAAKSIFRFGEINKPENKKEAEYMLIGTMFSFSFAIVVSLVVMQLLAIQ